MPQLIYQVANPREKKPGTQDVGKRSPIALNFGKDAADLDWFANTSSARIELAEDITPSRLVFQVKLTDKPAYIVHGARSEDFPELSPDAGISLKKDARFTLSFNGFTTAEAQATMVVLEYGEDRKRVGTFTVPLKSTVPYTPGDEVRHVVIAIRLAGSGKVTISRLSAEPMAGAAPAQAAAAEKEMQALSEDAEEWRRRAHDWEAQYYEAHRELSRPAARLGHAALLRLADTIPESNGSRYFSKLPIRLAIVTDVYMFNFYKDACEQVEYLSPTNYRKKLESQEFDAFLFVTCWVGLSGEEWRGLRDEGETRDALHDILKICSDRKITTIFQSIEDPSNYERFLPIARQMDHIFTSDSESIERYREDCGHDRVHYGEYGFNPLVNNPIGSRLHTIGSAFFAGSYPSGYASRCKDMDVMFGSILDSGGELVIADRNYWRGAASQRFPVRFQPHIIGPIDHLQLQKVHKLFRYNLNFNSIQSSPTMCAMRVYELLAQGRTLWSNYARSLVEKFPEVQIVSYPEKLESFFGGPETERDYRADLARMRSVLDDKSSFEIVGRMLDAAGFDIALPDPVIGLVGGPDQAETAERLGARCHARTVFIDQTDISDAEGWRAAAEKERLDYAAWLSPEFDYADCYLQDLLNAFKFTNARYVSAPKVGFGHADFGLRTHNYTGWMSGRERSLFALSEIPLEEVARLEQPQALKDGYNIDPFSIATRTEPSPSPARTLETEIALSLIVPVTEGSARALAAKTLPSLLRNRKRSQIELLLIGDGDREASLTEQCRSIGDAFAELNLQWCDAPAGSDRATLRNAGLDAARGRLVAFLDAGNEISPGGYDALIEAEDRYAGAAAGPVDFACGFEVTVGAVNAVRGKLPGKDSRRVDDPSSNFFGKGEFPAIPAQALAIRREWLAANPEVRFAPDAIDQDTLFGWTLLKSAASACFTNAAHVLRYDRQDCPLEDKAGAKALLAAEKRRKDSLEALGLLDAYLDGPFDAHFRHWYLRQIGARRSDFAKTLRPLIELYGKQPDQFGV